MLLLSSLYLLFQECFAHMLQVQCKSSTKGAINGLIKGMALDLAPKRDQVNSVCPAMIETNILEDGRGITLAKNK